MSASITSANRELATEILDEIADLPDAEAAEYLPGALAAVNAYQPGQPDAVAWRYEFQIVDNDGRLTNDWAASVTFIEPMPLKSRRNIERLYRAHPPAASARIAELTEALQNALPLIQAHVQHDSHDEYTAVAGMINAALAGGRA